MANLPLRENLTVPVGSGIILEERAVAAGSAHYYHYDALGSTRLLTHDGNDANEEANPALNMP